MESKSPSAGPITIRSGFLQIQTEPIKLGPSSSVTDGLISVLTLCFHLSRYVMFDRVCDNKWSAAVVQDYNKNKGNLNFDGDQFQKCKSQALAEQASGDVYFFIGKGVDADPGSAVSDCGQVLFDRKCLSF